MMKWFFLSLMVAISYSIEAQGVDTSFLKKITLKKGFFGEANNLTYIAPNTVTPELKPVIVINAFDPNTLPFFCKIEYKMGLSAKVPIKIRLGDPDKVDEMEKKGINH